VFEVAPETSASIPMTVGDLIVEPDLTATRKPDALVFLIPILAADGVEQADVSVVPGAADVSPI
jgi:hypothetical protein